jgi:hypothetical protein
MFELTDEETPEKHHPNCTETLLNNTVELEAVERRHGAVKVDVHDYQGGGGQLLPCTKAGWRLAT